jgi:hypothetical protein
LVQWVLLVLFFQWGLLCQLNQLDLLVLLVQFFLWIPWRLCYSQFQVFPEDQLYLVVQWVLLLLYYSKILLDLEVLSYQYLLLLQLNLWHQLIL